MEVKFTNVAYTYQPNTPFANPVLTDINLTFKEGQISGLVGGAGSGKTTILELTNGLLKPTKGSIKVGDFELEPNKEIKRINDLRFDVALVFQFPEEQFFHTTVQKEVGFGIDKYNYRRDEKDTRISNALKMVELDDSYLERDPFSLSNGEKRKVAIASILVYNPKIILFDEPTVGLDSNSVASFIKLIRLLKHRYHKTIVIATHDVDFLHQVADEVFVLNRGKIVLAGSKYDVFSDEIKLRKYGVLSPQLMKFTNTVYKRTKIKLGYRDDITDLVKDIYRHVQ